MIRLAMLLVAFAASQDTLPVALTGDQRAVVERGEPLQVLEPVSTSAWPRARIYRFIRATPADAAAVLSDYDRQADYSPRVKSSKVVRRPARNEAVVRYEIDVPLYPDEVSEVWHRLSCRGNEYDLAWHTDSLGPKGGSKSEGSARFVPWTNQSTGTAGTLMVYEQLVIPSSVFAGVGYVKKRAIQVSKDAADAIAKRTEKQVKDQSPLFRAERDSLAAYLGDDGCR